ncbi:MAG: hypothetical protein JW866_05590 [Ignavibacteriales bacterium]|nr:hypothetical protein [Ignavibacteriales bacterium]
MRSAGGIIFHRWVVSEYPVVKTLGGKTPWQKYKEVEKGIPIQPEVTDLFWESNEQVYARNAEFWTLIKEKNNTLKT